MSSFVSVVIPVYKSSESLGIISQQLHDVFKNKYDFEVFFVNDSPLHTITCETLESIVKKDPNATEIRMRKNSGQHLATLVGLSYATGDIIITIDDDLQHPISEIPKLIDIFLLEKNTEVIFAIPNFNERKHAFYRNIGSFFLAQIDSFFLPKPKGLVKSSFRVMDKQIVEVLLSQYNATPSITSILISITHNIRNVKVDHNEREYGKTGYNFSKLLSLTFNNLLHYSSLPLKVLGILGGVIFILSIVFIIVIVIQKLLLNINYPGYASTVILVSFFGSLNLFGIGIIGEYLIRIVSEQQKPDLRNLGKIS